MYINNKYENLQYLLKYIIVKIKIKYFDNIREVFFTNPITVT